MLQQIKTAGGVHIEYEQFYAVQFHPETILSLPNQAGFRIISNLMGMRRANAQ